MRKVKYFEDNLPTEPMTFHIVEMDMNEGWSESSPSKDCAQWGDDTFAEDDDVKAKDETRNYIELAGGQLLAWFVVDPRLVSGEVVFKPPRDLYRRIPMYLVCHWPKNPVDDASNFLGQAIEEEGCSGYGYVPIEMTKEEIKKLRLVRTIEAMDPDEAAMNVREEEAGDYW